MPEVVRTAAFLIIGDEILNGKVKEENLHSLAVTLRSLGIRLVSAAAVPDQVEVIARELQRLAQEAEVVFTSGGVGPTHDDVTIDGVARAFGVSVEMDPGLSAMLQRAYRDKLTESHLRMARVPHGAQLITTEEVPWPTLVMRNVWILPGIPELFRMKLLVVRESLRGPRSFHTRSAYSQLDEGELKPHIDAAVAAFPTVEIGSYPKWFDKSYKTKVTFDAESLELASEALTRFCSLLPEGEPVRLE